MVRYNQRMSAIVHIFKKHHSRTGEKKRRRKAYRMIVSAMIMALQSAHQEMEGSLGNWWCCSRHTLIRKHWKISPMAEAKTPRQSSPKQVELEKKRDQFYKQVFDKDVSRECKFTADTVSRLSASPKKEEKEKKKETFYKSLFAGDVSAGLHLRRVFPSLTSSHPSIVFVFAGHTFSQDTLQRLTVEKKKKESDVVAKIVKNDISFGKTFSGDTMSRLTSPRKSRSPPVSPRKYACNFLVSDLIHFVHRLADPNANEQPSMDMPFSLMSVVVLCERALCLFCAALLPCSLVFVALWSCRLSL